jgi:hypothetical protein
MRFTPLLYLVIMVGMNNQLPPIQSDRSFTLSQRFWAPLELAFSRAGHSRECTDYGDNTYLHSGVGRVLQASHSGREWVQFFNACHDESVTVNNFFAALRSDRRLKLLQEIDHDIRQQANELAGSYRDPFVDHPELDGFEIYASDGHSHGASAHEERRGGKKRAVTHLFSLNLRTHTMAHLTMTQPAEGKKKEHEITAIKRSNGRVLRLGAPKKTKVIHVYDPAIIDYHAWQRWKQGSGVYIITREKKNSRLMTIGLNEWDWDDPRNAGILSDETVGPSNGFAMRRVRYRDPATGNEYSFLTNESTLPPGVIAFLYKKRWDVEKVYDEFKNKMYQKQAWGKTDIAKIQQALFMVITHNLIEMLEHVLETEEGITDKKVQDKQGKRWAKIINTVQAAGLEINPMLLNIQKATQRSLQFIRWLRTELTMNSSWEYAVEELRPLMLKYLT